MGELGGRAPICHRPHQAGDDSEGRPQAFVFASVQSASISSSVASDGVRPSAFSAASIQARAAHDLGVGGAQGCLRVDLQVARQIGDDEQQIADFAFQLGLRGALRPRFDDLAGFLG